jgi:hypothetical protein
MKETYYTEVGITDRFLQYLDSIDTGFLYARTKFGSVQMVYEKDGKIYESYAYLCGAKKFKTRWQNEEQYKDPYNTWEIVPGGDGQTRQGPEYVMSAEDELQLFARFSIELKEFCKDQIPEIGIVIHTLIPGRGIFHPTAFTPLPGLILRCAKIPVELLEEHLRLYNGRSRLRNGLKFWKIKEGEGYSIYYHNESRIIDGVLYEPKRKIRYLRRQDSDGYITWAELGPAGDEELILDIRKISVLEQLSKERFYDTY